MLPQKYKYFLNRLIDMGPRTALWLMWHRARKQRFIAAWRTKHTNNLSCTLTTQAPQTDLIACMLTDQRFLATMPSGYTDAHLLLAQADAIANDTISILGYGVQHLSSWHADTTQPHPSPPCWRNTFYADIAIPLHTQADSCGPDIKVPWEFSRLQHLVTLGLAYRHAIATHDARAETYCTTFMRHITDWVANNPFLRGVNWANPMEVGIRSINLIWAFHLFKQATSCTEEFWQHYVSMLHNHAVYLEHNWEVSDKPNNHYLADLVGYWYLNVFFSSMPYYRRQSQATLKTIVHAFAQQLHPDGTSYEGSTHYHALDTELLLHVIMLAMHTGCEVPASMHTWYQKMTQFIADCSDNNGNFIRCGDDDGGRIVFGLAPNKNLRSSWFDTTISYRSSRVTDCPSRYATQGVATRSSRLYRGITTNGHLPLSQISNHQQAVINYHHFGISIIKTPTWHISFRHPTYNNRQPTGHFHHDHLAITLTINNTPLFIDPGSYVYTASTPWRNYFRSWAAHNTFFCQNHNDPAQITNLFAQTRMQHPPAQQPEEKHSVIMLHDYHDYFAAQGLRMRRNLCFDTNKNELVITDLCENIGVVKNDTKIVWAFHVAPEIAGETHDQKTWIFLKQREIIATFTSTCVLEWHTDVVAPTYGCKVTSHTLVGKNIPPGTQQFIIRSHN